MASDSADASMSAAKRAEARRNRILEKSNKRLAYASGLTKSRPSDAPPDTPPRLPLSNAEPTNIFDTLSLLSNSTHQGAEAWKMSEGLRVILLVIIAVGVGSLVVTSNFLKLSAVEVFVTAEAMMNVNCIVASLSRRSRWGGPLRAVLDVLRGLKLLRFLVNDFIVFIFSWMWAVRIGQAIRSFG